eukprot:s6226_g1.t1
MPKFDKLGVYKGPLPKKCGHVHKHKLIGKTAHRWNTAPSAAYPPGLCKFLAGLVSSGGGSLNKSCRERQVKRNLSGPQNNLNEPDPKRQKVEVQVVLDSDDERGEPLLEGTVETEQFDVAACCNAGMPIPVEWDGHQHYFNDGFGLCSPGRWRPQQRGERRTAEMVQLANSTFSLLEECVAECIPDVRTAAFRLVTGKMTESPFAVQSVDKLRRKFSMLLPDKEDAMVIDEGQPFLLRALSQWLKIFKDPDVEWLTDVEDSFASGVCVGVEKPLPRSPQVFPEKTKQRKLDDTEFCPIAQNYPSAELSAQGLEEKLKEEESLGRMHPSKLGVLKQEYGDKLRIASMAAIVKPDGAVRPLHDATHSVMVNHEIKYRDKIVCPGPAEISAIVRETSSTGEAPFCVSADIKAAHRLVKIRRRDWGYLCCRTTSSSDTVWVNHTGTFGVSSAPYWWAKLAGLVGRFVGYLFHMRWFLHMIYVDDLHGTFVGMDKFKHLWVWVLAFELVGTPFGYHKFRGGFASEFVGFHIRYDLSEVGISAKRGDWLTAWIEKAATNKFVVPARDFVEFLGRLGFVSQLLIWLKPHLSPLFAWASVTSRSTVGRLPETVVLTLKYILAQLRAETYMVSTARPKVFKGDQFRTDAKCANGYIVLAGWELATRRWFSLRIGPEDTPFLFKPNGDAQWASTSAELLASFLALHAFGWLAESNKRTSLHLALAGGTDNKANESLTLKRSTTKWPLMAINMQLSAALSKARLGLKLHWRPRETNQEADDLTNEVFSSFDHSKRVMVRLGDVDMSILNALVETREQFDKAREEAKAASKYSQGRMSKKFEKSPW